MVHEINLLQRQEIVGDKVLKVIFSVANSWYTRIATHVATIADIGFAVASQPPTQTLPL